MSFHERRNASANNSKQLTPGEFFKHGVPMSIILLMVLGLAMMTLWLMLDMPNLVNK